MNENSIRRAVREGRAADGTQLEEFASRGVPWIIDASGFVYVADLDLLCGDVHSRIPC